MQNRYKEVGVAVRAADLTTGVVVGCVVQAVRVSLVTRCLCQVNVVRGFTLLLFVSKVHFM
jgi:hypothetical protein